MFCYLNSVLQKTHNSFIKGSRNGCGIQLQYMKQSRMTTMRVRD